MSMPQSPAGVKSPGGQRKLPKLPGFSISEPTPVDQQSYKKTQSLTWRNGYAVVVHPPIEIDDFVGVQEKALAPSAQAADSSSMKAATLPSWLKHSSQVLRFFGYFLENVNDRPEETWRVRRVAIFHYLEDGSTQITEPRGGDTSMGISMGFLVRRSRIAKPGLKPRLDGSYESLGPADLAVGGTVEIHGRQIHIVDADAFTREHMQGLGHPQGPALPLPTSPIEKYQSNRNKPSGLTRSDPESPSRFAEALLGRAPSTKRLQQFLEGNSLVLRFLAVWDDTTAPPGVNGVPLRRPYKILYYLEDDTLEILELKEGNTVGREARSYRFLARSPLPKEGRTSVSLGTEVAKENCVGPADIRIGGTLSVHGRSFFIYDADKFTKSWVKEHLGRSDDELAPVDVSLPEQPRVVPQLPPHNGFGSPEDSERNCKRLIPTAPTFKAMRHSELAGTCDVLRFAARLAQRTDRPPLSDIDSGRRFVVTFFLSDGTISVNEPPVSNSGVVGGKFLERCKAYRGSGAHDRELITERDFSIGAVLELHGRALELLAADELTQAAISKLQGEAARQQ